MRTPLEFLFCYSGYAICLQCFLPVKEAVSVEGSVRISVGSVRQLHAHDGVIDSCSSKGANKADPPDKHASIVGNHLHQAVLPEVPRLPGKEGTCRERGLELYRQRQMKCNTL